MSDNEIVLYDLATKGSNRCFTPNVWKTRAALNFKALPYKTIWLEYPEVKPTLSALGIKPNTPENYFLEYSCPTIKLPNGSYVMDSADIAPILEQMQPEPSLHLDGLHERVGKALGKMFMPLVPALLYKVRDGLNPVSAEYYETTRKPMFGMGLDDFAKSDAALNGWKNAKPGIDEISAILSEQPERPYVLGEVPSYSDLVLASGWHCLFLLEPVALETLYDTNPAFEKHHRACQQWFERERVISVSVTA